MDKKHTDSPLFIDVSTESALPTVQKIRVWAEDRVLSADAEAWFNGLPETIRPSQLAKNFPRVCNQIARCWPYPQHAIPFLDCLLIDNRGGREGFPLSIMMEITQLKEHYVVSYAPHKLDIWDKSSDPY